MRSVRDGSSVEFRICTTAGVEEVVRGDGWAGDCASVRRLVCRRRCWVTAGADGDLLVDERGGAAGGGQLDADGRSVVDGAGAPSKTEPLSSVARIDAMLSTTAISAHRATARTDSAA
jgi:hypothetical protein